MIKEGSIDRSIDLIDLIGIVDIMDRFTLVVSYIPSLFFVVLSADLSIDLIDLVDLVDLIDRLTLVVSCIRGTFAVFFFFSLTPFTSPLSSLDAQQSRVSCVVLSFARGRRVRRNRFFFITSTCVGSRRGTQKT